MFILEYRICISFSADSDTAFYLNAVPDPYPDSRSQTNADPDPDLGQTQTQKVRF
jgi:hypothetical protein